MMIIKMLIFFICPQSVDLTKRFSLYYCSGILFGELVYISQKKSVALSKQQKYHLMVSFFSCTRNLWSGVCKDSSETRILRKSHKGHEGYLDGKVPEHCRGILQAVYSAEHRNTCYSYDKVKVKQLYTDLPALGHAQTSLKTLICSVMLLHSALYSFYSPHSEHMSQSIYCKAEINRDLVTCVFLVLRAVRLFSRRH